MSNDKQEIVATVKKKIEIKPVKVIIDGDKSKVMSLSDAMKTLGFVYTKDRDTKSIESWHKPWRSARAGLLKLDENNPKLTVKDAKGKDHTLENA
jgi:hypothetical protein